MHRCLALFAALFLAACGCSKPAVEELAPHVKKAPAPESKEPQRREPSLVTPRFSLDTGLDGISSLAISADRKLFVCQATSGANNLQLWDLDTKEKFRQWEHGSVFAGPVAFSPDGKVAAYVGMYQRVYLIDVPNGKQLRRLDCNGGGVGFLGKGSLIFSPDGDRVFISSDHEIYSWNAKTGEQAAPWKAEQKIMCFSNFFDDGRQLVAGCEGGKILILDIAARKTSRTFSQRDTDDLGHSVHSMAISSDGKRLATRHTIAPIKIWDVAAGKLLRKLDPSPGLFGNVLFCSDNRRVIFTDHENRIHIVDSETGAATHRLEGHIKAVLTLAISPDGTTLASAGADMTVKVWDVKPAP